MGRRWLGCVFGSGADSLAEVKGKWFPAAQGALESVSILLLFAGGQTSNEAQSKQLQELLGWMLERELSCGDR